MERSDEVRDLMLRLGEGMAAGDRSLIDELSGSSDLLVIGTDPAEWWEGERARAASRAQVDVFEDTLKLEPVGHAQGFVEGTVGWAAEEFTMTSPVGAGIGVRLTGVWHRDADAWKLIQWHASIGVPNEDSFGEDLPI
jgi:SnoaL-like domain